MSLRVLTIYGTRPEAIKVAPVIKAIDDAKDMTSVTVVTGQHREMLDQVNSLFGLVPAHDMDIMHPGQELNSIVGRVTTGVDAILVSESPDVVLVQGDTSTVMAASIASFNRGIPLVHLEAGLRSGDLHSPFPEEANRRLTSAIASLHLSPTTVSRENLIRENVSPDDIVVTGNTVIDALMDVTSSNETSLTNPALQEIAVHRARGEGKVLLVTAHRRENLGRKMEGIVAALADLAQMVPRLSIVFPVHRNPRVRATVIPALESLPNVHLVEPLDYDQFARTLALADIVLTDSGGVQEEAPSLGKPVLVMRENTERPEAVTSGTVRLIGTNRRRIVTEVSRLLSSQEAYLEMANAVNPYGDGYAAARSLEALRWKFMGAPRPHDFTVG